MSLSNAINLAQSGLETTQKHLNVTAGNIANAKTPGYTRKSAVLQDTVAAGQTTGVISKGIQRSMDKAVQQQYWQESASTQFTKALSSYLGRVDQTFGTPGGANALDTNVNKFSQSLQALVTSPDSAVARQDVLNQASLLVQNLNTASNEIQGMRQEIEGALDDSVDTINAALKQIEDLNNQIQTLSINGNEPSSLLDQRDLYISQIADQVDIKVQHGENNTVRISTTSGTTLFDRTASQLEFNPNSNVTAESKWSNDPNESSLGSIILVSDQGNRTDLTADKTFHSGKIAALLELRDKTLVEAQAQLDELAAGMAKAMSNQTVEGTAVTAGAQAGSELDLAALQAGNELTLTYEDVASGETRVVTFVKADSAASAGALSDDHTARSDDKVVAVDFSSGMANVVSQIQSELGAGFTVSNPSGDVLRILDDGAANTTNITSLEADVTVTSLTGTAGKLPFFVDGGTGNQAYTGSIDGVDQKVGLSARLAVNTDLIKDSSKLVQYDAGIGAADQTRPQAIYAALEEAEFLFSHKSGVGQKEAPAKMTVAEFTRQVVSFQGAQARTATIQHDGQLIAMNNVQSRMEDGSKVNVDSELARLMELQSAYAANARVLSTVKEMLDALMRI